MPSGHPAAAGYPGNRGRRLLTGHWRLLLAVIAVAVAGTTSSILAGSISGQPPSRVCGVQWKSMSTQETLVELYEISESDRVLCDLVKQQVDQQVKQQIDQRSTTAPSVSPYLMRGSNRSLSDITMMACEQIGSVLLQGRGWVFDGGGWSGDASSDPGLCDTMRRSGSDRTLSAYWLYDDGQHGAWKFRRARGDGLPGPGTFPTVATAHAAAR
jgi:hypothetical protein